MKTSKKNVIEVDIGLELSLRCFDALDVMHIKNSELVTHKLGLYSKT